VTPYYANGEPELACEAIKITVGSRPAGAPKYIRRNIAEMPPGHPHLKTYQEGVRQLKALDVAEPDNPFCWSKQSQIHGSGKCQHSFGQPNLYFLPWHRAYLFYLEEAIRTVTEREDFALPYWSWTQHPKIPKAFLGGETNPLWHSNRSIDPEETPWVEATQQRQVEGIQDNIAFGPFSRGLERSPHNFVHSGIGGDMQDPVSAASDPIFYCHHANVDRIWGEWNEDPDPQRGSNPNTQSWKENFDVPYTAHFFTRDKEFAEVQNRDLSSTRLPKLDYRYDTQKEVLETEELNSFQAKTYYVQEGVDSLTFSANTITVANTNTVIERRINVTNPRLFDYIEQASRTRPEQNQLRFVKVLVEGMKPPAGDPLQIRIFINCEYIDIDIPTNDPHYVSSFSFFESSKSEHQHHEGHQDGYRFSIDLTETLRKLRGTDSFPTAERGLDIQMVALPGNAEGAIRQYQPGTVKVGLVIAKAFLQ
ncbi:MAG: tyrosinase family protein, partial [Saprospiraceae bacterium]|nr:tyrosinase family protein [Saprospiraceae bacterium]